MREKALTCLALAAFYEAGDDAAGQSAVVQVVLNRVRHPAFPDSICATVLQGSTLPTGCQFTFTCDGAMARRNPSAAQFERARSSAAIGLGGGVFAPVGNATHYHTDWVLPRWSGRMDKIAAFHGHLFFRWRGQWGRPAAFGQPYSGIETLDARFAAYIKPSFADDAAADVADAGGHNFAPEAAGAARVVDVAGVGKVPSSGAVVLADEVRHIYYIHLEDGAHPGRYAVTAWNLCAGRSPCIVFGWSALRDVPAAIVAAAPAAFAFSYRKSADGRQESLWDCRTMPRTNAALCLPGTAPSVRVASVPPGAGAPVIQTTTIR